MIESHGGNEKSKNKNRSSESIYPEVPFSGVSVRKVACGKNFTLILLKNGQVFTTGLNEYGTIGIGKDNTKSFGFQKINFGKTKITDIKSGYFHFLCIDFDGNVYSCGNNGYGQCLLGHKNHVRVPQRIKIPLSNVDNNLKIFCGQVSSYMLDSNGNVYSGGCNIYGMLGLGHLNNVSTSTKINNENFNFEKIKSIFINSSSCFVFFKSLNGNFFGCGENKFGQLGINNFINQTSPIQMSAYNNLNINDLSIGNDHVIFTSKNGNVYTMGWNGYDKLGIGYENSKFKFTNKPQLIRKFCGKNIIKVIATRGNSFFIARNGDLYSCGDNRNHMISKSNIDRFGSPLKSDLRHINTIECGYFHNVYMLHSNDIIFTGMNDNGQMGLKKEVKEVNFFNMNHLMKLKCLWRRQEKLYDLLRDKILMDLIIINK